jgi:hypothetical protein
MSKWEDDIEKDITETKRYGVHWFHLVRDRIQTYYEHRNQYSNFIHGVKFIDQQRDY